MPTENFINWANKPDAKRIIAVILSVIKISDSSPLTLYFASQAGYWDGSHYFEPVLPADFEFSISENTQIITHGETKMEFGALPLVIESGIGIALTGETWDELLGGGYAWADQLISVYVGGPSLAWADWEKIEGYMGYPAQTSDLQASLPIYPLSEIILRKQIPPNTYEAE